MPDDERTPEEAKRGMEETIKRAAKLPHKTQKQLLKELREAGKIKRGRKPKDQQS